MEVLKAGFSWRCRLAAMAKELSACEGVISQSQLHSVEYERSLIQYLFVCMRLGVRLADVGCLQHNRYSFRALTVSLARWLASLFVAGQRSCVNQIFSATLIKRTPELSHCYNSTLTVHLKFPLIYSVCSAYALSFV